MTSKETKVLVAQLEAVIQRLRQIDEDTRARSREAQRRWLAENRNRRRRR